MKVDDLVGFKMMKKLLRNRKGTAEVIGSVMFIVILLFFFTNVYLWHDAAVREMNDLYINKVNSPVAITVQSVLGNSFTLEIATTGGLSANITRVWIIENNNHSFIDITDSGNTGIIVLAGDSRTYTCPYALSSSATIKVITSVGNIASCEYP